MKADTIEGLLKEYSQFLEEEKVDLLREEGGRLWRANNELKKEIAMGEKKVKELDELIARHKETLDLLAKPTAKDLTLTGIPPEVFGYRFVLTESGWAWESPGEMPTQEEIKAAKKIMSGWNVGTKPAYSKTEPFLRAALSEDAVKKIVERVTKRMAETMNEYKPKPKPAKMNKIRSREVLKGSSNCVKYVTYTWPKSAGDRIPDTIVADLAERIEPENCIEAHLRRGANICDLLANPALNIGGVRITPTHAWARTEPAQECGCLDKVNLIRYLEKERASIRQDIRRAIQSGSLGEENYYKGKEDAIYETTLKLNQGKFDRAPCKPEPAGEVIGFVDKTHLKIQLDDGREMVARCSDHFELPKVTRPALDKDLLVGILKGWIEGCGARAEGPKEGYRRVIDLIEAGSCNTLPSDEKPAPSKPALDKERLVRDFRRFITPGAHVPAERIPGYSAALSLIEGGIYDRLTAPSTADLVEMLRQREWVTEGVDITELGAYEQMTIGGTQPTTVIAVRKEDRS